MCDIKKHLESDILTIALCIKIVTSSNIVLGFTQSTSDLIIDGITYNANPGFLVDKFTSEQSKIDFIINDQQIKIEDIMHGDYDNARIEVFLINYLDLNQKKLNLYSGYISKIKIQNDSIATADIESIEKYLDRYVTKKYSPICRAELGDASCNVHLDQYKEDSKVDLVISNTLISATLQKQYYSNGEIAFKSGLNQGKTYKVISYNNLQILLLTPTDQKVEIGDKFTITAGCDKTISMCKNTFDNINNFRGEPHIPGCDYLYKTA
jgi:uncharacterized phage protein (TIGR02218 family)